MNISRTGEESDLFLWMAFLDSNQFIIHLLQLSSVESISEYRCLGLMKGKPKAKLVLRDTGVRVPGEPWEPWPWVTAHC